MLCESDPALANAAALLSSSVNYRVLRRLDLGDGSLELQAHDGRRRLSVAAALDVETTGLDVACDKIIELAIRRFAYDEEGRIVRIGRARSWREDPGEPLHAEITRVTGLSDADLAGQSIDAAEAAAVLTSCRAVFSHNAAFDRPFVERRLPRAAGLDWGCSLADVDWAEFGFEGRALGWLAAQSGWFFDAHRAAADVDALIALLAHAGPDRRTVLASALEGMNRAGWKVSAEGAGFEARHVLKARGYRWDGRLKEWWREVRDGDVDFERRWLEDHVYAPGMGARRPGPRVQVIHSGNRYSLPS